MKRETFIKNLICAWFVGFVVCLGAQTARAQNLSQDVRPIVDCVERERDANGALTGKYTIYYGYINSAATSVFLPINSAANFTSPVRNPPGQPDTFLPGIHPRVFSVTVNPSITTETWRLSYYTLAASFSPSRLCDNDGANSRLITYQGKLNDGAAAANGVYDLQFQLFDAATGGTARSGLISAPGVTVTNGVFTVQLNLGAGANTNNQAFNAAIQAGEDVFLEIGVRPRNPGVAFTILTPRQPLTAVPLAMRANKANNAIRAAVADGGSDGFYVSGDMRVSGSLTASTKDFLIDHPLDPLNKTLTYTSVESPDMKNIYDGTATTDANGEAIVTMPAYFEALNKDFRYQLTVIGQFAQAIISEELKGNQFKIKTDKPNVKVSWQVTGIRHDKYAEENRPKVEQEKSSNDKGKCLYAPSCQNKP